MPPKKSSSAKAKPGAKKKDIVKIDESDSEEVVDTKKKNKKPTPKVESDSEEEIEVTKKPIKKKPTPKVESDSEEEIEVKKKPIKKKPTPKVESDSEEEVKKKTIKKKPTPKVESDSDSEEEVKKKPIKKKLIKLEEESDSDIEIVMNIGTSKKMPPKKIAEESKKNTPLKKKEESPKKALPKKEEKTPLKKKEESPKKALPKKEEKTPLKKKEESPKKALPKKQEKTPLKKETKSPKKMTNKWANDLAVREIFLRENKEILPESIDPHSPYFENMLNLYKFMPTRWNEDNQGTNEVAANLWKDFLYYFKQFDTIQEYENYYRDISFKIINSIRNSKSFKDISNDDMRDFPLKTDNIVNVDIDSIDHSRNYFSTQDKKVEMVLLDLKKGNYQSLQYYDAYIQRKKKYKNEDLMTKGTKSYDEFVKLFTDDAHIMGSRGFRQITFMSKQLFGTPELKDKIPHLEKFIKQEEFKKISGKVNVISNMKADEIILYKPKSMKIFDAIDFKRIRVENFTIEEIKIDGLAPAKETSRKPLPRLKIVREYVPETYENSLEITNHYQFYIRNTDGLIRPQVYKQIIYPLYGEDIPEVDENSDRRMIVMGLYYALLDPITIISKHSIL